MTEPPDLLLFGGDWATYEDGVYEAFLETFVRAQVSFRGVRVTAPYRPPSKGKHFSFWHVISEAPSPDVYDESQRIPDLRRCERIRWIAWVIEQGSLGAPGFTWWRNTRRGDRRIVIWAEDHDFAVVLGERTDYLVLKTAFSGITTHRRREFERERNLYARAQKG